MYPQGGKRKINIVKGIDILNFTSAFNKVFETVVWIFCVRNFLPALGFYSFNFIGFLMLLNFKHPSTNKLCDD